MSLLYLAIALSLNSIANITVKVWAESGMAFTGSLGTILVKNAYLFLALLLFCFNIIFYTLALRTMPLTVAYPVMIGTSFIIVNGYALIGFGEKITSLHILGYVLLIGGIICVLSATKIS